MNEKIKALMALAMVKSSDMSRPGRKELDPEKFAELIVKECADAADMGADATEYVGDYVAEHMGFGQDEGVTTWRTK
jgi:hypothetical protein